LLPARPGLVFLRCGDALPRGLTTNRLPRKRGVLLGLEPAFAVAIVTIDPALAGSCRRPRLPQALIWSGSGHRSGRLGRRLGREEVGKNIRSRRGRDSCDKKKRGEPEPQMTGHGIPRFAPCPRTTFGADLGRNTAQIWRRSGFILARKTAAAKGALLLPVN